MALNILVPTSFFYGSWPLIFSYSFHLPSGDSLDCEQSLFFFSSVRRVHAHGHLRVLPVLLDGPRKKRETAHSLVILSRGNCYLQIAPSTE